MIGAAAPTAPVLSRVADRALLPLLVVLLVALMTSITLVGVVTALIVVAGLVRLADPALRARDQAPLAWPLLAFTIVTLASALHAAEPRLAVLESKGLIGIALFLAAANGFRSGDDVRRALRWLWLAVAVVSLHAMAQTWACAGTAELPPWVGFILRVKLDACRAASPFRAKAFFSIYMTLGGSLVIVLSLLAATFAAGARARRTERAVTTGLAAVAMALTYVRSAWLGLAVAVLVVAALTRRYVVLLVLLAATAALVLVPSPLQRRALSAADRGDPSTTERLHFWAAGARMIRDAPVLGFGPGGVKRHYPAYRDPAARRPNTGHLHNNLVQIAVERGLAGLAAWLAIWVAFFAGARRVYAALPAARAADRALVVGSVAAVVGFLIAGLFEYNFGDSEVIDLLWVVMAFPFVVEASTGATPAHEE